MPAVTDVVIYADTIRSPELRHEVPLALPDPFLYIERDGHWNEAGHKLAAAIVARDLIDRHLMSGEHAYSPTSPPELVPRA